MPSIYVHPHKFIQVTVNTHEQLLRIETALRDRHIYCGLCSIKSLYAYTLDYSLVYSVVHNELVDPLQTPEPHSVQRILNKLTRARIDRCLILDEAWPLRYHKGYLEVFTQKGWIQTGQLKALMKDHPTRYTRLITILNGGREPIVPCQLFYALVVYGTMLSLVLGFGVRWIWG